MRQRKVLHCPPPRSPSGYRRARQSRSLAGSPVNLAGIEPKHMGAIFISIGIVLEELAGGSGTGGGKHSAIEGRVA